MAAYERVTLNRGGRNSRFDCNLLYLVRQADKFLSFNFASAKVILFWCFTVIIMLILIEI